MSQTAGGNFLAIALLMVAAGIGIPLMATLNASLGQALQSAVAASVILFGLALVIAIGVLCVVGIPPVERLAAAPARSFFAAVFVVFYLLSITWAAPRIGLGNAVFFVLFGQILAASIIDHFGLWGAIQSSITWRRVGGMVLMAVGVYLARRTQ